MLTISEKLSPEIPWRVLRINTPDCHCWTKAAPKVRWWKFKNFRTLILNPQSPKHNSQTTPPETSIPWFCWKNGRMNAKHPSTSNMKNSLTNRIRTRNTRRSENLSSTIAMTTWSEPQTQNPHPKAQIQNPKPKLFEHCVCHLISFSDCPNFSKMWSRKDNTSAGL